MKRLFFLLVIASCFTGLSAQGAFETALQEKTEPGPTGLTISGYSRATGYLGISAPQDPILRSLYNETSLKLKAKAGNRAQAYSDLRFRVGTEYGTQFSSLDIREAYVDLFLGKLDFRIGKQISPWGRADGWNPTDNLTPSDYFVRSPEYDDMRIGNYRIRGQYAPVNWLKLEADLAPWYTPSVYRFDLVEMPSFVTISPVTHPGFQWDKTSVAAKLDLIFPSAEGSISWFNGYDPLPGLRPGTLPAPPFNDFKVELLQTPFRQHTFGADFATIIFGTGIRGEAAYKIPEQNDIPDPLLPNPEIQWVVSADRSVGPFRIIAGYMGKYVDGFVPAEPPQAFDPAMISNPEVWPMLGGLLTSQIGYYNRILFDQTNEWNHSMLLRPSITLLHETLEIGISTLYNFTTEEYLLYPKATYHMAGGLLVSAGYQYYQGKEYTRFDWIEKIFNGPFFEFRLTF